MDSLAGYELSGESKHLSFDAAPRRRQVFILNTMSLPFRVEMKSKPVIRQFWETWQRIPEADRAALMSHILIVSDNRAFCPFDLEAQTVALTLGTGDKCVIYLNVRRLAHYKPQLTRAIIAHELAHVFCEHFGNNAATEAIRQSEADEQAHHWGFLKANYELNERRVRLKRTSTGG